MYFVACQGRSGAARVKDLGYDKGRWSDRRVRLESNRLHDLREHNLRAVGEGRPRPRGSVRDYIGQGLKPKQMARPSHRDI